MIQVNNLDIMISRGDTFNVIFNLNGYTLDSNDTVVFSIKNSRIK